jgi:carbon-monoxide dehydrogenase large subunit
MTGQALRRRELPRLLRGEGRYAADVRLPGLLHMAVLRSPHAHARLAGVDVSRVRAALAWTAADLPRAFRALPVYESAPGQRHADFPTLASDRVRYVGEPVAVVVAASRYEAEDQLERVRVAYEPLPAVTDAEAAQQAGSPLLWPEWGTNVAVEGSFRSGDCAAAFAAADAVVEATFRIGRSAPVPLEGRAVTASWDGRDERFEIWYSTQWPFALRDLLARGLGLADSRIRIRYRDVGGGFGGKVHVYPEDVLVPLASRALGRPVTWSEDRREHLTAAVHARQQVHAAALALRRDGAILGLRDRILADVGAHLHSRGNGPAMQAGRMLPGPYRIPAADITVRSVVTNKTPVGAYRGYGQPEAAFVRERLVDLAAARLGLDPAEIRRRNLLRPDEFPYRTCTGIVYDTGDYPAAFEEALRLAGYEELRREQRRRGGSGAGAVGLGLSAYVECTGAGPSCGLGARGRHIGGYETAVVRMEPSGAVTVHSGIASQGQGQETTLAQVCAAELGLPVERVRVVLGDTSECPYSSYGTAASRGAAVGGSAVALAARGLREKLLALAAHLLEVRPEDLEPAGDGLRVRGAPARAVRHADLAREAYLAHRLPPGQEPGLEARASFDPPDFTYAAGFDVAVVEVDPGTGEPRLLRYASAHDCGRVINPAVVEGQVVGGLAQGIGGALYEELVYGQDGQPACGTFMDYLLPTACELPADLRLASLCTPASVNPTGVKGTGESGVIPPAAALANAVADATGHQALAVPLRPADWAVPSPGGR